MPLEINVASSPLLMSLVTVVRKLTAGGFSCGSGYSCRTADGNASAGSFAAKILCHA